MRPRTLPCHSGSFSPLVYRFNGWLTIINTHEDSAKGPSALALSALGWILSDDRRARRFLDLTGLTPEGLRGAIGEIETHRAIFEFLCAHEPDLLGAAETLGVAPGQLVAAKEEISR